MLKLLYGMREQGQQWILKIEEWMIRVWEGVRRPQLFIKRGTTKIGLLIAKTDDILVSGKVLEVKHLMRELRIAFTVRKVSIGGTFKIFGCEIYIGDEVVEMAMWDYLNPIRMVTVAGDRYHQGEELASYKEEGEFRSFSIWSYSCLVTITIKLYTFLEFPNAFLGPTIRSIPFQEFAIHFSFSMRGYSIKL